MKKNVQLNANSDFYKKIKLNKLAISGKDQDSIDLYSSEFGNSGTSAILDNNLDKISVDTILSEVINKFNLKKKKLFIKIDVEGYEYELLKNNMDLIKNLNCDIYFSLHPINLVKKYYGNHKNKFYNIKFFIMTYIKLIRKLPFKHILINSKKISLSKLIIKSILYPLPEEINIMCTNKIIR